jgi:hypothetical protein
MYPDGEMTRLAARKVALRRDIALHRAQCAAVAARVVQPLEWLDRALAFWRQLSPLAQIAAVPLGIFVQRTVFRRRKILRTLMRWGPLVFGAARVVGRAVRTRGESPASSNG